MPSSVREKPKSPVQDSENVSKRPCSASALPGDEVGWTVEQNDLASLLDPMDMDTKHGLMINSPIIAQKVLPVIMRQKSGV